MEKNMEAQLRRHQNTLRIMGPGVIIIELWVILKAIAIMIMVPDSGTAMINTTAEDDSFYIIFSIILFLYLAIDIGLRLFIGLSARAEGMGKKKSVAYVVFAILLALVMAVAMVFELIHLTWVTDSVITFFVSAILNLTSIWFLIQVVVASIRVRKLKKMMN